jgi:tuftelin-interacting protein 11
VVSDDEEPRRGKGKGKQKQDAGRKADAWREPKKAKARVVHKTYEQIVQEAGGDLPPPTVGTIIDVTGATVCVKLNFHVPRLTKQNSLQPREISIADISTASWTPSTDPMRLPEVRHNLRLLVDVAKGDLNGLAREAKALKERKKWVEHEDDRLRKAVANEAECTCLLSTSLDSPSQSFLQ